MMEKTDQAKFEAEMKKNMAAYDAMPADWVAKHKGKVALFTKGKLVDIYDTMGEPYRIGIRRYGEGKFALKKIGASPIHLGVISAFLDFKDGKDETPCPASEA